MTARSTSIDYKVFADTGKKVFKINTADQLTISGEDKVEDIEMADQLIADEAAILEDIKDFLEENQLQNIAKSKDDLNEVLQKAEQLRSKFRRKHKEMEILITDYEEKYGKSFSTYIAAMKEFILMVKQEIKQLSNEALEIKYAADACKEDSWKFAVGEVEKIMFDLNLVVKTDLSNESNEEIKQRNDDQINITKKYERLGHMISNLIKDGHGNVKLTKEIDDLKQRYESLHLLKDNYIRRIKSEIDDREIEKMALFKSSTLKIKLKPFADYNSEMDIYTFQNQFEKLHLKTTPRKMLPDLLKNNFLEKPALTLVKNLDDIDSIWSRLKESYGDCNIMLSKKLKEMENIDGLWKSKQPDKIADGLAKIINLMKELLLLAEKHDIQNELFYGESLQSIYKLLGDQRMNKWLTLTVDLTLKGESLWLKLIEFLEKDLKVNQKMSMVSKKSVEKKSPEQKDAKESKSQRKHYFTDDSNICHICGETDHIQTEGPAGKKLVQYFCCEKFVKMSPGERFKTLMNKGLCVQCLFPGAKHKYGKHKEGKCQNDYSCQHESHDKYTTKLHVLVCDAHKDNDENKDLLQTYKQRCILTKKNTNLPQFSKYIHLMYKTTVLPSTDSNQTAQAIYMLQTIKINGKLYNIFYDSGCADFVVRHEAAINLGKNAIHEYDGTIQIGGVGGVITETPHGIFSIKLPLVNGNTAMMTGTCLNQITHKFPIYPLQKVESDIRECYRKAGNDMNNLPRLPPSVGGHTDFMIGIKYLRYFPEKIFQLPSGLTIYKSHFQNYDGSGGVIGGPHEIFTEIERHHHINHSPQSNFISNQLKLFQYGYQVNPDVTSLQFHNVTIPGDIHLKENLNDADEKQSKVMVARKVKLFDVVETAGSEISYRCVRCRDCTTCKSSEHNEVVSIKEEIEQDMIEKSVSVDVKSRTTTARLPLIHDPVLKLCPNRNKAEKVYYQQLRKLNRNESDKDDVIKSEAKLQELGHVDFVKNLDEKMQDVLVNNKVQNFIPWRCVWKDSSISTPCRMVFDASQPTNTGFSLNNILAKGRNNMNKLVEVFIRWRSYPIGIHTDIKKMYNTVKLNPEHWCLQRYLWQNELDENKPPEEKIIKTLIYCVKSSGNQAENGLRRTANASKHQYPEVNEMILKDVYVDDCLTGEATKEKAMQRADEIELVLSRGGFALKGVTMSGSCPHDTLSSDGININVAGMIWTPEPDRISLDIKELNFAKKIRGKKKESINDIPTKLTRRHCASKIAEVYDMTGLLTPITAIMKLDLHNLVTRKLDWDDKVPDNLRDLWINHFKTIAELKSITFQRAVVPTDAVNLDVNILGFGDASQHIVCVAIYARYKRTNGKYSCQLVFARSRLVPDNLSLPRAELYAALVNSHSTETVKRAFYKHFKSSMYFTDSQITLHWISNQNKALKPWIRNRVIEIQRFTNVNDWRYINSSDMVADIGTRRGTSLADVSEDSKWSKGLPWMTNDESKFPSSTIHEIKLNANEVEEIKKEVTFGTMETYTMERKIPNEVLERFKFSNYLIDPNKYRFKKVVRIMALVIRFIKNLRSKSTSNEKMVKVKNNIKSMVNLSEEEIKDGERYFFLKATQEIKHFLKPNQYDKISEEKDGILIYTGRILPTNEITVVGKMTNAMKDLSANMFCVPVLDKFSPVAYSVINEVHWYDQNVKHAGVESVWRFVLKKAFIIHGRNLVKSFKSSCMRCRYLSKKKVDVAMGLVSPYSLTIAPGFYNTQVDLCGPFNAYSHHHKRATIKIWLVVFVCISTSTTNIKTMENYSTSAFIQAFIRFSCECGYPKRMLSDEGSQLKKAFESMELNYVDTKQQLHTEYHVDYEICPVGAHNVNGKVERKIKEVKKSLSKTLQNCRLSIMQWETISSEIANNINNLPLALGNVVSDFETMDLLTPNRLRLGRNNSRSPTGSMVVTSDPDKIFISNQAVYDTWFENWLLSHVPKLMSQPKWFSTDKDLQKGDVVLFLKQDSVISSRYQYGIIENVEVGKDNRIRKVNVKYKNSNEDVFRFTHRSVRDLVVIHHYQELDLMEELGKIVN